VSRELDLLRAFRTTDAAVDAGSQEAARAALLARINDAGPVPIGAGIARRHRRVFGGRFTAHSVALIASVLVVAGVGAVMLSVSTKRPATPARPPLPRVGGPPVLRNYAPGKPPPLPGYMVCNADLAPPGAIAGLGGPRSGMLVANAAVIGGVNTTPFSITAKGLAPSVRGSTYAVWLEPAVGNVLVRPVRPLLLGVIKPGVGADGRLATRGMAPDGANGSFLLLITVQRGAAVTRPGRTVLLGFVSL
jgi:hypothetical protein